MRHFALVVSVFVLAACVVPSRPLTVESTEMVDTLLSKAIFATMVGGVVHVYNTRHHVAFNYADDRNARFASNRVSFLDRDTFVFTSAYSIKLASAANGAIHKTITTGRFNTVATTLNGRAFYFITDNTCYRYDRMEDTTVPVGDFRAAVNGDELLLEKVLGELHFKPFDSHMLHIGPRNSIVFSEYGMIYEWDIASNSIGKIAKGGSLHFNVKDENCFYYIDRNGFLKEFHFMDMSSRTVVNRPINSYFPTADYIIFSADEYRNFKGSLLEKGYVFYQGLTYPLPPSIERFGSPMSFLP